MTVSKVSNWKPAAGNDSSSHVRIQELHSNRVDGMQFGWLPLKAASHLTPSVLSN